MRFTLIDKITLLEPDRKIEAVKNLSLAEEYLSDHFPHFPVMPGVFMLEALTQASAWLIRASEDFANSMVVLSEARNVKYTDFVSPGQQLTVTSEIIKQNDRETQFKAVGTVDGSTNVTARIVLMRYNLADSDPAQACVDERLRTHLKSMFKILYPTTSMEAVV
jgi:3-hydroxyacyl-[acyl-carrier-protein] dehydratase